MKKILMIITVIMTAVIFAACGDNTPASPAEPAKPPVSVTEETKDKETETQTETQTETEEAAQPEDEYSADDTQTDADAPAENPLQALADTALAVGEWPMMMPVEDESIISDYFLLDKNNSNYRNLIVMQCPMTANMSELIIIEAEDTASASEDLEARLEKAKQTDAFYPEDVEKAQNAIVGTAGNYAYYIFSSEPAKSEEALLMQIEG